MKNIVFIVFIIFIMTISCNRISENRQRHSEIESLMTDSSNQFDNTGINVQVEDSDDCIFDQLTQTDEFLKDIKELQNYKWNYDSRTATIILDNSDTLLITRGGCYHFGVTAEFRISNKETDFTDWNNVYNKVLWIAKLLDKEFAYTQIKNEIDSHKVKFGEIENGEVVYFSNDILQQNHYEITRQQSNNLNIITLSYYIE